MKTKTIIITGLMACALSAGFLQGEVLSDKYAPLRTALADKKQEAIVQAEDALFWAEEFEKILEDAETGTDERLALRQRIIQEQSKAKSFRRIARELEQAIRSLRRVPDQENFTISKLHEAYGGLGELGEQGRNAWNELLANRNAEVTRLEKEYEEALAERRAELDALETTRRANDILLTAVDSNLAAATEEEFRTALKLPALRTAVQLGFGIKDRPDDREHEAQTILLALVGYSQFFWDHHADVREELGEEGAPADRMRNIFGVPDGKVLTSSSISKNESSIYHLSPSAKASFNARIRAIWGSEGSLEVSQWDQDRANTFARACRGLASTEKDSLKPNRLLFELLDEVDALIDERAAILEEIPVLSSRYAIRLAEAKELGDRASLSSAHYNAEIWAEKGAANIVAFENSYRLLDQELAASADGEWTPKSRAIAASAEALNRIQDRYEAVREVKHDLATLLQ